MTFKQILKNIKISSINVFRSTFDTEVKSKNSASRVAYAFSPTYTLIIFLFFGKRAFKD